MRAVHINELRSAVDNLRTSPPCNLGGYAWTDNPVGTTTHIRAVHFTELRSAIQDVWNCHSMGALPNWSYGSAPSPGGGRPISARDINDLRGWVNQVDPSAALCGLHWQSPVTLDSSPSRTQFDAGAGFGSVLILSPQSSAGGWSSQTDPTTTQIYWLEDPNNRTCHPAGGDPSANERSIVRLYWPMSTAEQIQGNPADQATEWQAFISWCQGQAVYNFVVLNEPDIEYNSNSGASPALWYPGSPSTVNSGYMHDLAAAIRSQNPNGTVYLGFPGPSGNITPLNDQTNWDAYWDGFHDTIVAQYNNFAVHAYGTDLTSLEASAAAQARSLQQKFPNHPIRFTEYDIAIANFGGDHNARAGAYASFVKFLRNGNDPMTNKPMNLYNILACHVYIAGDLNNSPNDPFILADSEAATLTTTVGCVPQHP